jgi:hypothetical protein
VKLEVEVENLGNKKELAKQGLVLVILLFGTGVGLHLAQNLKQQFKRFAQRLKHYSKCGATLGTQFKMWYTT